MKTQRRRGFTVVELVVVIAIIAVLAAVLIPTFTSIIKKANDSAALQERTNQRLEDIAQKVDNANWLSWEDFEAKLAQELAKIDTTGLDKKELNKTVTSAVTEAMKQYEASHGTGDTALTKEQVEIIVEKALEGQLTSAQVEAIVRQAIVNSGNTGVSEAQVRQIVNAAVANIKPTGVTKPEMQKAITDALKGVNALNTSDVQAIVAEALKGFSTLTEEQVAKIVEDAVKKYTPAENTIYIAGDMELSDPSVTYVLRTMNALGTVTLTVPDGVTVKEIIIDAPNVQTVNIVYKNGASALKAVGTLTVISTASTSTHVKVKVTNMEVNSGRAVVEVGATVDNLTAAPSKNADVTVVVEQSAQVGTLNAEYQDNGTGTNDTIKIINKGTITKPQLTASDALENSGTTTTNVSLTTTSTGTNTNALATESGSADKLEGAFVQQTTTSGNTTTTTTSQASGTTVVPVTGEARIGNTVYDTIEQAIAVANANTNGSTTVVLLKDVAVDAFIAVNKSMTIDGAGYTINSSATRALRIGASNVDVTVKNIKFVGSNKCERVLQVDSNKTGVKFTIDNVEGNCTYYAVNICSGVWVDLNITNSKLTGWNAINLWSDNYNIYVNNSELIGINDKGQSPSNTFATICLEGDTTGQTELGSSRIVVDIENSKIVSKTISQGNIQAHVAFNANSANNIVTFTNCIFETEGTNVEIYYDRGCGNVLKIQNSNIDDMETTSLQSKVGPYLYDPSEGSEYVNKYTELIEDGCTITSVVYANQAANTVYIIYIPNN